MNGADEKELIKKYISCKENTLKRQYLSSMANMGDGTVKEKLYEIFKDEIDIINGNLL